jgi:hypothetical protein
MAASDPASQPEFGTEADEEARILVQHSRTARQRASALQSLMTDVTVTSHPTTLPQGHSVLGTAADAIAQAISAPPRAEAVGSSPPRGHIRMAPHLQPADKAGGWKVWERRGSPSASNSTSASAPPSPQKVGAPGIRTSNRFEAIREETRVRQPPIRKGKGWRGRLCTVVVTALIALTAIDTRGTIASHEWHDQGHDPTSGDPLQLARAAGSLDGIRENTWTTRNERVRRGGPGHVKLELSREGDGYRQGNA